MGRSWWLKQKAPGKTLVSSSTSRRRGGSSRPPPVQEDVSCDQNQPGGSPQWPELRARIQLCAHEGAERWQVEQPNQQRSHAGIHWWLAARTSVNQLPLEQREPILQDGKGNGSGHGLVRD